MGLATGSRLGPYEIASLDRRGRDGRGVSRPRPAARPRRGDQGAAADVRRPIRDRLQRFEQEARATAALNDPNIVAIYDVGTVDGQPYVVSELLEGETLRRALAAGPLPLRKAVAYAQQIARGMAAAHRRGIVHRDLKPENVFVTARRPGEDPRLRPGQAHRSDRRAPERHVHDGAGRGARHRRLHVARAGARRAARSPLRHLLVRRGALRDAVRRSAPSRATRRSRRCRRF